MDKIFKELGLAITVCKKDGEIVEMNDFSKKTFLKNGEEIIGNNVLDCHPEPAKSKLIEMLKSQSQNAYTIEKNGVKKLIYQTPWFENGEYMGFVELSMIIPNQMPHYVRRPKE